MMRAQKSEGGEEPPKEETRTEKREEREVSLSFRGIE